MNHNQPPCHNEDEEKIHKLSLCLNNLLANGSTSSQVRYLYGEDVPGYVEHRLDQQSPNARTITTFARKVTNEPRFQYVAISKTIEDGYPDDYVIYFLDNYKKNHVIVSFQSNSRELVLNNLISPEEKEFVKGDTLSLYIKYFEPNKMTAIDPNDSVELSTCFQLMETLELENGK